MLTLWPSPQLRRHQRTKNDSLSRQLFKKQFDSTKLGARDVLAKQRLVEQFYMPKLETPKTQSYSDLVSVLGKHKVQSPKEQPKKDDFFGHEENQDFPGTVRLGQLVYVPIDREVTCGDPAVAQMLEVDQEEGNLQTLNNILRALQGATDSLERSVTSAEHGTPKQQLEELAAYLSSVASDVNRLGKDLRDATQLLQLDYQNDMQVSVNKLDRLGETLGTLGDRLLECKRRMQHNKDLMGKEMAERIEVLDYILRRFSQYDQRNRQRRASQMVCALVGLICVGLVYGVVSRF